MDQATVVELSRETLLIVLKIVSPALIMGMLVGLTVSLFMAITSVQEQTLTLVPKMLAVAGTILLLLPWIMTTVLDFATHLFENLSRFAGFMS
ncbi:MAG: flagellar biosynthetic protein FliQ [Planctomycetota bacterium]